MEKTLIDQLGLHYLHAHQIATRAEQAAVRAGGISWRAYDRFMQKFVKAFGDERLSKVPADLDTKPYRDEHDLELLRRMMAAIEGGKHPPGSNRDRLKRTVERTLAETHERHRAHVPKGKRTAKRRRK